MPLCSGGSANEYLGWNLTATKWGQLAVHGTGDRISGDTAANAARPRRRGDRMKRRAFIMLLSGAAVAWPLAARAQQAAKLPTIGYLGATAPSGESQRVAAFVQGLRELRWIESRNIALEYRYAEGRNARFAEIATELVRLKVDVIVTYGTLPVVALKQARAAGQREFRSATEMLCVMLAHTLTGSETRPLWDGLNDATCIRCVDHCADRRCGVGGLARGRTL
jgi:hypothetical protein